MSDKALLAYFDGWRKLSEWESNMPMRLSPQQGLDAISSFYEMVPPETRERHDDSNCEGLRTLIEDLERLRG